MATLAESKAGTIEIERIGGRVGAVIKGVQLSGEMPPEQVKAIWDAMLRHKVIFLRDQQGSDKEREAFAELLGQPVPYVHLAPPDGSNYAYQIDSKAGRPKSGHWHFDVPWLPEPVDVGILAPVKLPEYGGETTWSNTAAAYEDMPDALKAMADQLWAVHSAKKPLALTFASPSAEERLVEKRYVNEPTGSLHPIVRVHPETGEKALLTGSTLYYIEGFTRTPGQHIFELLDYYIKRPENTLRWHWRMGDVAIWDNRCTQHYGVTDYDGQHRVMRRISLKGSRPRGVNGELSQQVD